MLYMALSAEYLEQLAAHTWYKSSDAGQNITSQRAASTFRDNVQSVLSRENLNLDASKKHTYIRYAARLKRLLLQAARSENIYLPPQSITHTNLNIDNFGRVSTVLQIDSNVLWRDSLYMHQDQDGKTHGHKYGTDNILAQMETGWSSAGGRAPAGYWHGKYVRGRGRKTGTNALLHAVQRFNSSVPEGIEAQLLSDFTGLAR